MRYSSKVFSRKLGPNSFTLILLLPISHSYTPRKHKNYLRFSVVLKGGGDVTLGSMYKARHNCFFPIKLTSQMTLHTNITSSLISIHIEKKYIRKSNSYFELEEILFKRI